MFIFLIPLVYHIRKTLKALSSQRKVSSKYRVEPESKKKINVNDILN